jgi:hypothetical protein
MTDYYNQEADFEAQRQEKQKYLVINVVEAGYDTAAFA